MTDEELNDIFAANMRRERIAQRYSQRQLAEALSAEGIKVNQQWVSLVEDGKRRVTVGRAVALSAFFGVTLDEMLSSEDALSALREFEEKATRYLAAESRLEEKKRARRATSFALLRELEEEMDEPETPLARAKAAHPAGKGITHEEVSK